MAKALGLEARLARDDLGKRVGRVLGRVGRHGAEGLKFAHRPQPGADGRALPRAPFVDRHRELSPPEPDCGERHEELVLLRVQQVQEPRQAADMHRRGMPLGVERLAKAIE